MGIKILVACLASLLLSPGTLAVASGEADRALVDAVKKRDTATLKSLLEQGADVNVSQADGATPLHWATYWDDLETAELLIRARAKVDATDDYGVTPLTLACTNGSAAMVRVLLNAGAAPSVPLPTGETVLMRCARTGSVDGVKLLLEHGADPNATESSKGQTALMWAVAQKHADVAQVLIEHGANVHLRSKSGFTPLLFAARIGDIESAQVLLAAGEKVNESMPVKGPARAEGTEEQKTAGITPLLMASASGQEAFSIFLLENGADPNVWDGGAAPLHYAVMEGIAYLHNRPSMPQLVKALIAHGANPNVRFVRSRVSGLGRGGRGATPFLLAAAAPNPQLMRTLLAAGADPKLVTDENVTPLMAAAGVVRSEAFTDQQQKDAIEAIRLMLDLGADINAANESGRTALIGATTMVADPIIQLVAEHGANLDAKDIYQQTPLSIASGIHLDWVPKGEELGEEGAIRKSTVDLLLKLGAKPLSTPGYFTLMEKDSDASRFNPKQGKVPVQ